MPTTTLHAGTDRQFDMHYEVDSSVAPWRAPETILMMHGNSESGVVWYGWVPHLLGHYRLVRPDMRGFGKSTPMPDNHAWTLDELADDYAALMRTLGIARFHVVAAKFGGSVARRFAARYPELVISLTLVGTPTAKRPAMEANLPSWVAELQADGVESWARRTMGNRLGTEFDPQGVSWWVKLMGSTALSTQIGFMKSGISVTDLTPDLSRIRCPALVFASPSEALGSVDDVRAWQEQMPNSRLYVVPGNSYHVAATAAELCALETLRFIRESGAHNAA
jgi:3-oxoadipate enol-lactonase